METVVITTIRVIDNKEGRLDKLKPLLSYLALHKKAKQDRDMYIVDVRLFADPNRSKEEMLFFALQQDSALKRFSYNCFNFADVKTKQDVQNSQEDRKSEG